MQFKLIIFLGLILVLYKISLHYKLDYEDISTFYVDFDKSMQSYNFQSVIDANQSIYTLLRDIYEKNNFTKVKLEKVNKIPKIIHQIWLGSEFPAKCAKLAQTFKDLHPDWKYILWSDKDIVSFKLENQQLFDSAINWGEKSDIWRYEILYRYGGVYIDADFQCLRPLDIFNNCYDFYVGVQPLDITTVALGIGLIGACQNHPILKIIIDNLKNSKNNSSILERTGPVMFTKIFCENINNISGINCAFPASYFYPLGLSIKYAGNIEQFLNPESFAVHHWYASWA